MLAARLKMEIVVEARDAVNFGTGNVKYLGHNRQRFLRQISELRLKGMQDRQGSAFLSKMTRNDAARGFLDCWRHDTPKFLVQGLEHQSGTAINKALPWLDRN